MTRTLRLTAAATLLALSLTACQDRQDADTGQAADDTPDVVADRKKPAPLPASPGKLSAPISIDYSIMGNPVVGQPVGVNIQVSSPLNDRPITVRYRVHETGSMSFPESQAESTELLPLADAELRTQQVTVVPQREGRLYLVVSAEIETDSGAMMKSMSIPIQVGRAPATPAADRELVEGSDGEIGVSLPATDPR